MAWITKVQATAKNKIVLFGTLLMNKAAGMGKKAAR